MKTLRDSANGVHGVNHAAPDAPTTSTPRPIQVSREGVSIHFPRAFVARAILMLAAFGAVLSGYILLDIATRDALFDEDND